MNKAKGILQLLADGQEAAGLNGATLSKELRDALSQGAKALEFKQRVVSALNQTAVASSSAAPREGAEQKASEARIDEQRPKSVSRRWNAEEDAALRQAFEVEKLSIEAIAEKHQRSPFAIAIRLQKNHQLLTEQQVENVRTRQVARADAPAQAPVQAPAVAPVAAPVAASVPPPAPKPTPQEAPKAETAAAQKQVAAPSPAPEQSTQTRSDYDDSGVAPQTPGSDSDIPWSDESSVGGFEMAADGSVEPPAAAPPAAPVDEGPDYAALFEMELSLANEAIRTYVNDLLKRLESQPHIAPSIINLLDGDKMKAKMPTALRLALLQKVKAKMPNPLQQKAQQGAGAAQA